MGKPAAAANSASSSVETLSEPDRTTRSEEKSPGCRSWSWISAQSAAGIMAITVGWWSRSSGKISWASVVRATTTRPPTERAESAHRKEPRWDIEEAGRKTSVEFSSKAAAALAIIQRSDSRVCVTPFAGPVDPEVKKMAAGMWGSKSGPPASGSAANRSSKWWFQPASVSSSACSAAAPCAAPGTSSSGASRNTTVPRGSEPASSEVATSAARSAWATSAAAVDTERAWSISRAV